jgi:hypothetical protein
MMQKAHKTILLVLVNTLVIVGLTITPALSKDSHNKKFSHLPSQSDAPKTSHHDEKPGPAWKTIGGTAKNVHGDIYAVEDYEGNQVTLRVGQGMKRINKKKVGDPVRAEITRGGLGNSIQ